MADLNVMMREHALSGLNAQLDQAVTNGDTEAARKVTRQIADLTAASQPTAPPYGDVQIKAALEAKAPWFGTDPRKSGAAVRLGKDMNIAKFATAEAFAEALIKAVEEEFPTKTTTTKKEPPENETDEEREAREAEEAAAADDAEKDKSKTAARRATDGPGEHDTLTNRGATNRRTGPWTKLSEAPADVQKEVKRQLEKFVTASATKEQREAFTARSLEAQYNIHQRNKGKK